MYLYFTSRKLWWVPFYIILLNPQMLGQSIIACFRVSSHYLMENVGFKPHITHILCASQQALLGQLWTLAQLVFEIKWELGSVYTSLHFNTFRFQENEINYSSFTTFRSLENSIFTPTNLSAPCHLCSSGLQKLHFIICSWSHSPIYRHPKSDFLQFPITSQIGLHRDLAAVVLAPQGTALL